MKQKAPSKILLVEDCTVQSAIMERWLEVEGHSHITIAPNGQLACQLVQEQNWDLVISDIELPLENGLKVLQQSKKSMPDIPVCLLTGKKDIHYAVSAIEYQTDEYLLKPLNRNSFVEKVNGLLERNKTLAKSKKTILAIGAHPDDVEIGCGGTLLNHVQNGDQVIILTLSQGSHGGDPNVRNLEARQACEKIGATLIMEDLDDTKISSGLETIQLIEKVIKEFHPDIVYTHTDAERHQDHKNVHLASMVACRSVSTVYCYQSPSSLNSFNPVVFTNIENQLDQKIELINQYQTQTQKCPYLEEELIRSTARYWGRFANYGYVEAFEIKKESNQ